MRALVSHAKEISNTQVYTVLRVRYESATSVIQECYERVLKE
jgi:hypothetical protein